MQLDRGLYGVLVVDDPAEPGGYDDEWVVVLDDWVDGTGRTPDEVLADLRASSAGGGMNGMGGMDHGSMPGMGHGSMGGMGGMTGWTGMQSRLLGGAGDVEYPHYLVNGRTADAPVDVDRQARATRTDPVRQRRFRHGVPGRARWAPHDPHPQ